MTVKEWIKRLPWTIVITAIVLMLIGYSGIVRGDELAKSGNYAFRQIVWISLGIPFMFLATIIPYRSLRWFSYPIFFVNLLLLILVYFMPARNGAHRWIPLGIMDVQPSEIAKLTYMMALAHYLMYRDNYRRLLGLIAPFILTLLPVGLILREPDLGTSLLFLPVLFVMLFSAGARSRHLLLIGVLGLAMLPVLWMGMSAEQKSRIVTIFTQNDTGPTPKGDGYQLHQSKRMLALGSAWGSEMEGMAIADPAAYRLPAARTDFILCLVGERWGLLGTLGTLLLYLFLIVRGLSVASATREPFGRLLAVGIVALMATQVVINAGMTVGLMPITGLTLPLVSYGGASLISTCLCLGLLMNIGMHPGYEIGRDPFYFGNKK